MLNTAVTSLNGGNGVVRCDYAPSVTYYPPSTGSIGGIPVYIPGHFTSAHVKMECSDRGDFSATQADDIGFNIAVGYGSSGPLVTETLHSWGDSQATFTPFGANDGTFSGDDSSTAHTAIALIKTCASLL